GLAESDGRTFAHGAAYVIYVLVMEDREEPGPKIRSLLPEMQLAEGAGEAILNEIVSRGDVASQRAGVSPQTRDLGFDAPINVGHELPSHLLWPDHRRPKASGTVSGSCNPMMS